MIAVLFSTVPAISLVTLASILVFLGIYTILKTSNRILLVVGSIFVVAGFSITCVPFVVLRHKEVWRSWIEVAFAALASLSSAGVVLFRNALYAALSFAIALVAVGGIFLLYGAGFLMVAVIVIYTGAIVVAFLFVIMLAQQAKQTSYDVLPREPLLTCTAGLLLINCLTVPIFAQASSNQGLDGSGTKAVSVAHYVEVNDVENSIRTLLGMLDEIKEALVEKKPRDELVNLLEKRKTGGKSSFAEFMEGLDLPFQWNENNVILSKRRAIRTAYNELLATLAEDDAPNHELCLRRVRDLELTLADYFNTVCGQRHLTAANLDLSLSGLAKSLCGYYAWPIQLAGFLLLIATIGTYAIGVSRGRAAPEI